MNEKKIRSILTFSVFILGLVVTAVIVVVSVVVSTDLFFFFHHFYPLRYINTFISYSYRNSIVVIDLY